MESPGEPIQSAFEAAPSDPDRVAVVVPGARVTGSIFDGIADAIIVADLEGRFLVFNPAAQRIFAAGRSAPLSWEAIDRLRLPDRTTRCPDARHPFRRTVGGENVRDDEMYVAESDGNGTWISISGHPLRMDENIIGSVVICRDVSERKQAQEELARYAAEIGRQTAILDSILENMREPVTVADGDGAFVLFNAAASVLFGRADLRVFETPERHGLFLTDGDTPFPAEELPISRSLRGEPVENVEMLVRNASVPWGVWFSVSARPLLGPDGRASGALAVFHDVSTRKRLEEELKTLALIDDLTGLYNRRGFLTLAADRLKVAERQKKRLLLLFADIDGLKVINDSLGHAMGDEAIKLAAAILRETFRESDVVARLGGDEFAVLSHVDSPEGDTRVRERLLETIRRHADASPPPFPFSLSIGTREFSASEASSFARWLASADEAMYSHKRKRRPSGP